MPDDARISTAIRNHPKTRKLQKRLGREAVLSLIWLFLYVAESRPDGNLEGMSAEDIELSADWSGEESKFVEVLSEVGFLDGDTGNYRIHDWFDHNPWAATRPKRIEAAKAANRIRWERQKTPKVMPIASESDANRTKADSPPLLSSPPLTTKPIMPTVFTIEPAPDGDLNFQRLCEVHPKPERGHATQLAYLQAVEWVSSKTGKTRQQSMDYIAERAKLYASLCRFQTGLRKWLDEKIFEQKDAAWSGVHKPTLAMKNAGDEFRRQLESD